ncbi:hypothetical protein BaRGS_00024443 [Batillaria attramentaria]|uniref:Uncharacterized protein n=1 Tax=Batillaria attramentaria TaxID=370345 RepID=A0ABD0KB40_9CAEN
MESSSPCIVCETQEPTSATTLEDETFRARVELYTQRPEGSLSSETVICGTCRNYLQGSVPELDGTTAPNKATEEPPPPHGAEVFS